MPSYGEPDIRISVTHSQTIGEILENVTKPWTDPNAPCKCAELKAANGSDLPCIDNHKTVNRLNATSTL